MTIQADLCVGTVSSRLVRGKTPHLSINSLPCAGTRQINVSTGKSEDAFSLFGQSVNLIRKLLPDKTNFLDDLLCGLNCGGYSVHKGNSIVKVVLKKCL